MSDMPRPRPPHLHKEVTRHGAVIWYVRMGKGKRIRIKGVYGSPEFNADYQAALSGAPKQAANELARKGSLQWLIDEYRRTAAWARLAQATRRQRENIFKHVLAKSGQVPFDKITRKAISDGIDRRKATPAAARNFLEAMRGLFRWAASVQHVAEDPTIGIKAVRPKTEGFKIWTHDDCARYEAKWKIGTRERLAYDLLLFTGLRRGDAVKLGKQHVRGDVATIRTEKTGEIVSIRLLQPLLESIAAGPCGDMSFIAGANGRPMVKESFGTWFRIACRAAKVDGSAHGLRKAGATRAAEAGATAHELMAMFGWTDLQTAEIYTRRASRLRLAMSGGEKLEDARKLLKKNIS